ncbi:MAG: hypothetical protein KZQ70_13790, partial [gamma proteobacterium symbiont of Lucinoma myriamae]|nr:hypothetical protein [gamma proteobacterium symbiont of Lucinoma myriamae]
MLLSFSTNVSIPMPAKSQALCRRLPAILLHCRLSGIDTKISGKIVKLPAKKKINAQIVCPILSPS